MLKTCMPNGDDDDSGSTIARLNDIGRALEGQVRGLKASATLPPI